MKQKIPLTKANLAYLKDKYQIPAEILTVDYWIKYVMANESLMQTIFNNPSTADIQIKIKRKARRLMRKHIRHAMGLPEPSGAKCRQRKYNKLLKKSGLEL